MIPDSNTSRYALPGRFAPQDDLADPSSLPARLRECAAALVDGSDVTVVRVAGLMVEAAAAIEDLARAVADDEMEARRL